MIRKQSTKPQSALMACSAPWPAQTGACSSSWTRPGQQEEWQTPHSRLVYPWQPEPLLWLFSAAPLDTVHRQTSERQTSETTNVRTTNVRKDKRKKRQTSERTNVRSDKRQKRQTSEGTNVRKTNVGKTSEKNVRKTSENHNIIYTINILIFWRLSFLTFVI